MVDVRLSVAIIHARFSPERVALLEQLIAQLGGIRTIQQETTSFTIVADDTRQGCWPVACQAWQAWGRDATHHLVLCDDAICCSDFLQGVQHIARIKSDDVLSFYTQSAFLVNKAQKQNTQWIATAQYIGGLAILAPVVVWKNVITWSDRFVRPDYPHDDGRIGLYCMHHHRYMWHAVPSLVDHFDPRLSLVGHRNPESIAACFLGLKQSALSIDWTRGANHPVYDQRHIYPPSTLLAYSDTGWNGFVPDPEKDIIWQNGHWSSPSSRNKRERGRK